MSAAALDCLRQLATQHENMARMADLLDWDGLTREWQDASNRFATLQKISLTGLSANERTQARELIEKLLTLQERISGQARPWMDQVRPLLDSFERHPLAREPG